MINRTAFATPLSVSASSFRLSSTAVCATTARVHLSGAATVTPLVGNQSMKSTATEHILCETHEITFGRMSNSAGAVSRVEGDAADFDCVRGSNLYDKNGHEDMKYIGSSLEKGASVDFLLQLEGEMRNMVIGGSAMPSVEMVRFINSRTDAFLSFINSKLTKPRRVAMKVIAQSLMMHACLLTGGLSGGIQSAFAQDTADVAEAAGAGTSAASEMLDAAAEASADIITDSGRDNTLISRVLWYTAVILLVYVTVGTIILSIDSAIKNRNYNQNRLWIRAWLDGDEYPSNLFLDQIKNPGPPKDLPKEPYTDRDKGVKRTKQQSSTTASNRQLRRDEKRIKAREARKSAKFAIKTDKQSKIGKVDDNATGNRANRRASKKMK